LHYKKIGLALRREVFVNIDEKLTGQWVSICQLTSSSWVEYRNT